MKLTSAPPEIGSPVAKRRGADWVQTERAVHEAWARFALTKPAASALLHVLIAKMGHQNAVVVSQNVLAGLVGVTDRTIRSALGALEAGNWIQVVHLGKGREAAYVVNSRVGWTQSRSQLNLAHFSATIIADAGDQRAETLEGPALRAIPLLYPGERQLPSGPGEDPPSQPHLDGMEPDLPSLAGDVADRKEVEARE